MDVKNLALYYGSKSESLCWYQYGQIIPYFWSSKENSALFDICSTCMRSVRFCVSGAMIMDLLTSSDRLRNGNGSKWWW